MYCWRVYPGHIVSMIDKIVDINKILDIYYKWIPINNGGVIIYDILDKQKTQNRSIIWMELLNSSEEMETCSLLLENYSYYYKILDRIQMSKNKKDTLRKLRMFSYLLRNEGVYEYDIKQSIIFYLTKKVIIDIRKTSRKIIKDYIHYGKIPDNSIINDILSKDLFSRNKLIFKKISKYEFVIYSVGYDMKDDKAMDLKLYDDYSKRPCATDIGVRINHEKNN
ncbi:MAG: hypothetical protein A2Y62_00735 [Candidatus Fischerbacteria bacterium RBG_13_37_8]|uniref:Uncharacterized protein n=1 Tax=Candidatus Fischerbacteria bacterium RBG_13_37_8 TaxID=1817863 RepID=A0A1F5VWZ9_9BACT|nr:MAG: hypothetical protein A2Y62_00735 [Candidatus Fischerbacteria bacterium RBG_13_37_8]